MLDCSLTAATDKSRDTYEPQMINGYNSFGRCKTCVCVYGGDVHLWGSAGGAGAEGEREGKVVGTPGCVTRV